MPPGGWESLQAWEVHEAFQARGHALTERSPADAVGAPGRRPGAVPGAVPGGPRDGPRRAPVLIDDSGKIKAESQKFVEKYDDLCTV